jgi:enoyl-CoA hydratase/carnithine racemase
MADLSITAANVKLVSGPTEEMVAGATLTAAQAVYKEGATKKAKLADNDNATSEIRAIYGLTLHAALADQPIVVAKNGAVLDLGAILTAGVDYYLSGTAGGIAVRADVTSGHDPVRIGMALTTAHLQLDFNDPGVTL